MLTFYFKARFALHFFKFLSKNLTPPSPHRLHFNWHVEKVSQFLDIIHTASLISLCDCFKIFHISFLSFSATFAFTT